MSTTGDEHRCPYCGSDVVVVNQLFRCVGCDYVSLNGHSCPECGDSIAISDTSCSCEDCTYSRRFPTD